MDTNGTRGHFITKPIEVNQGHSKTKTYTSNDLPSSNDLNKGDQNIYIDSQSTFELPSEDLQPPYYTPVNNSGSQTNNISSHGRGHRKPKKHSINSSSQPGSEDLIGSGNNHQFLVAHNTIIISQWTVYLLIESLVIVIVI